MSDLLRIGKTSGHKKKLLQIFKSYRNSD
jgi:hypothetical protein